jgi:TonB family protein
MRALAIGLAASIALAGAARAGPAEPYDDGTHWIGPDFATLKQKWPHDAAGRLLYGKVELDCGVGADGSAADCKVLSAEPPDPRQIKAALSLAGLFKARARTFERAVIDLDLSIDEDVESLEEPDPAQIRAFWPPAAQGAEGSATLKCIVTADGRLTACSVLKETPAGLGFGAAALAASPSYRFKPAKRLGEPVETDLILSLAFASGVEPGLAAPDGLGEPPPTPATRP